MHSKILLRLVSIATGLKFPASFLSPFPLYRGKILASFQCCGNVDFLIEMFTTCIMWIARMSTASLMMVFEILSSPYATDTLSIIIFP